MIYHYNGGCGKVVEWDEGDDIRHRPAYPPPLCGDSDSGFKKALQIKF